MAILKKIRSATLVEALTATVIVVIIFVVASLVINNMLLNMYNNKTRDVEGRLNELQYQVTCDNIRLPYAEQFDEWKIETATHLTSGSRWVVLNAANIRTGKRMSQTFIYEKQ